MAEVGNWERDALCAALVREGKADTEWWFPFTKGSNKPETKRAIKVCQECPVWRECRDFAAKWMLIGVWGGVVRVTTGRKPLLKANN